VPDISLEQFGD
jgi:hypothetical protein